MRDEREANRALDQYADMVRRICFIRLKHYADVEDVFQDVFLKFMLHDNPFDSDAHEKAWLIRVAINACSDIHRSFFRKHTQPLEATHLESFQWQPEESALIDAVFALPPKYRDAIYLHYYEGYSAVEIARILKKKVNTIYTWMDRARKLLAEQLGGEPDGKEVEGRTR